MKESSSLDKRLIKDLSEIIRKNRLLFQKFKEKPSSVEKYIGKLVAF